MEGVSFEAQGIFSNSPCIFKKSPGYNKLLLSCTLGLISFKFHSDMLSYDIVEVKLKPFHVNCNWFLSFFLGPGLTTAIFCLFKGELKPKIELISFDGQ